MQKESNAYTGIIYKHTISISADPMTRGKASKYGAMVTRKMSIITKLSESDIRNGNSEVIEKAFNVRAGSYVIEKFETIETNNYYGEKS